MPCAATATQCLLECVLQPNSLAACPCLLGPRDAVQFTPVCPCVRTDMTVTVFRSSSTMADFARSVQACGVRTLTPWCQELCITQHVCLRTSSGYALDSELVLAYPRRSTPAGWGYA